MKNLVSNKNNLNIIRDYSIGSQCSSRRAGLTCSCLLVPVRRRAAVF